MRKKLQLNCFARSSSYAHLARLACVSFAVTFLSSSPVWAIENRGTTVKESSVFEKSKADIPVKGKITDKETGEPLIGVSVMVKGTGVGASTDASGNFSINSAPENGTLVITYIGYNKLEVPISNRRTINIALTSSSTSLNEVVVVGYGTQKKATLTGAVSQVKGSDIVQSPSTNVTNSLAGRLAGLVAVTPTSEPGYDGSVLRIRGVNTMNNNNPLVVVDGIPGRSLERIDPSVIESISVLKDASAAIYGAQAANGVILVTTKRGKVGKPTITASFNQGYGTPTRLPDMADAPTYATMINEIAYYKNPSAYTPIYTDEQIQKFADGSDPWNYPNTDWFDEVLKPWAGQNYGNMSVTGGSEAIKYLVSLSGKSQGGFYYNSGTKYNQYDFRTNLDGAINKNISVAFDVAGRMEDRNFPTRSAGSIFRMVMRGKPTMTAYWPNGMPGPDIEYGDNPVVVSTKATGYDHDKRYVLNSNMKLNVKIPWVEGLSLTGNASLDKNFRFQKTWQTPWYLYSFSGFDANNQPILEKSKKGFDSPALNERMEDNQNILLNALVNYQTKFLTNNDLNLLVGVERITGKGDNFSAYRKNFTSSLLDQMFAGATDQFMSNDGSAFTQARLNYFGRVNYAYKQKYLAEFVWRYQGSYIFPQEKRFGFFPGISIGYNISEEPFWKNHLGNTINSLKIRGSWGQTGNDQINEWQYLATYDIGGIRPASGNPRIPYITNGGVENPALYQTVLPNPNVTWEVANQSNIGFDATLLNSKLSLTADFFNYTRSQILWYRNASVPTSSGLAGMLPRENIGKMGNKGFDFSIGYNNKSGDFEYQIGLNGGYQKNRIIFWDEAAGAPQYQQSTGHPYNSQLWYKAIGVFHNQAEIDAYPHWSGAVPGDIKFEDYNNDGKIDALDRIRYDKSDVPTFQGGLSFNLAYKGFDLSALVQGSAGAVRYISTESGEIGNFLESFAEGRWTPENPNADKPRTFNRGNEYWVGQGNTYWAYNSDYIRLKNIELGYRLPNKLISKVGIQNLRVYVNAYNFLTYSPHMKDFDPELTGTTDNGTSVSTSGQGYPLQKIINGGLSVTF
ncbi:SusC/RagA family TonB-linked outer membrane protein [Rubrolithibacter danxiaensis]|uniref:SusC/RagA family TonB-linked outer membrane protein n=1 Tax=Rubrolithibacter danxiaensis TaxID=3390805 RepID=UPI003BF922B9